MGHPHSEETKKRLSLARIAYLSNPVNRRKLGQTTKKYYENPENREKARLRQLSRFPNADYPNKFFVTICPVCNEKHQVRRSAINKWLNNHGKTYFSEYLNKVPCQPCTARFYGRCKAGEPIKRGPSRKLWKGRGRAAGGYIWIHLTEDSYFFPMAMKTGFIKEHRLVMAQYLGRCLHPWEIVHHRNHIRDDNRIKNLYLTGQGEHTGLTVLETRITKLEKEVRLLRWQNKQLLQRLEILNFKLMSGP